MTTDQRRPKLLVYGIILAAFVLLVNLGIVLFVREGSFKTILIDLGFPVWYFLAALGLFAGARRSALRSRRLGLAWAVLGLAEFSLGVGCIFWVNLELWVYPIPFPSVADVFYVAFYPLFLLGILLLPISRLTRSEWLKTGLDMTIVLLAVTLVLWHYWLSPLLAFIGQDSFALQFVSLAYPVGDLVLFSGLLILLYRQVVGQESAPLFLLAAGTVFMIVSDVNYGYQGMLGTDASGAWLDLGWVLCVLSHGLAGIWQATSVRPATTQTTSPSVSPHLNTWLTYLPYAWVVAAYLMLEMNGASDDLSGTTLLTWGLRLIIGLVLLRQIVTLRENSRQAQTLSKTNHELQVEIGERKRAEKQLAHDAVHDALTGLPNRVLFMDRLHRALAFAKRHAGYRFAVLFLDLDHFKVVNDSLGHAIGDQLLIGIAQRLRLCLRAGDTVARLGGDEFVVLLEDTQELQQASATANRILVSLQQPFNLQGHQLFASASIGIVTAVDGYSQPEEVLRDADIAMYEAKTHGKARCKLFSVNMRAQAQTRLELENDLRQALERDELELHYQPILALQSDRITGFEALLRWHHPQRGLVTPNEFIPIAEETSLIVPIGQWVLHEACRQLRDWQVEFPQTPPLTMSVNISGVEFAAPNFGEQVATLLQEVGLDPTTLRLELTESVWLNSTSDAVTLFRRLSSMGIQLHIDDFGTGYSSLAYLQHFPIRTLKIDRAFLNKMGEDSNSKDLVRAVIAMAHDLGMEAVAEGVETLEQLNDLKQFGCNYGQGFLLSRPINREGIEQLLKGAQLKQTMPKQAESFTFVGRPLLEQISVANA